MVHISQTAARYILETAISLVSEMYGISYTPRNGELVDDENINAIWPTIPDREIDLRRWISLATNILRTVAGMLHRELDLPEEMPEEIDEIPSPSPTDVFRLFRDHDLNNFGDEI